MKNYFRIAIMALSASLSIGAARADHRLFTYTYEPEVEPAGDLEYEQSITLRSGRNSAVGQDSYNRWQFRHEIEYGVTENYTASLYLNHDLEYFRDSSTGTHMSDYSWTGLSFENR